MPPSTTTFRPVSPSVNIPPSTTTVRPVSPSVNMPPSTTTFRPVSPSVNIPPSTTTVRRVSPSVNMPPSTTIFRPVSPSVNIPSSMTTFRPVSPSVNLPPSTTTFRSVSPSVNIPASAPTHSSPQRTRKLETPLHLDGGLFSDIRSPDGKLLSKVTIDRVHSSTRHDASDEPGVYESTGLNGNKDFVDNLVKTETITNEDVIKVKFTPIPPELDSPRLFTPSQFVHVQTNVVKPSVEYIKDNFEDLQSYKIVNSLYKEKKILPGERSLRDRSFDTLSMSEPVKRAPSPLANFLVSEQLTKIDSYLQESLNACSTGDNKGRSTPALVMTAGETKFETAGTQRRELFEEKGYIYETSSTNTSFGMVCHQNGERTSVHNAEPASRSSETFLQEDVIGRKSKVNSVKEKQPGVLRAIYDMPIHYHAAILCFLLIVYNLVYQYIKHNCHGNKK